MNTAPANQQGESWRKWTVACLTASATSLPFSHVPAQIALAMAFIGWIGWSIVSRRAHFERDPFLWAAAVYWAWNGLASALSIRPGHSLGALVDNEWPALLGLLVWWSIRSTQEIERLVKFYVGAAGVAFAYGIVQTFTGVEWIKGAPLHQALGGFYRAVGFSGFYLTFAGFAMSVFYLAAAYSMQKPSEHSRWIVPLLALGAILGTFARSVWLSMALLVPLTAIVATTGRKRFWALGVAAIIALTVLTVEPLRERAVSIFDLTQHETRLNLWKTSIAIAQDHPWIGIGQDNFTSVFEEYRVPGFYDTFVHPHNDYLSTLVHGGIPALMAFLAMWALVLCKGWNTWKKGREGVETWLGLGGTVAVASFLLSSLFQNYYGTFVNCFNWWLVTGVVLTSYSLATQLSSMRTASPTE
ncbi:MAG: O-antigen ligase family protein [Bacteroidetes bacterium]|jgi:putative inorganic carbon (HCO3(-)) transporter|nr:O-antigen ligase family protein [Bacteroidota bacterium]